MPKLNLRPRPGKPRPLGHPQNPIPLPSKRRILVTKKMYPFNPFDSDPEDLMPSPFDDSAPPKMRIYRFFADGTQIEAATQDAYTWRCTVKDANGKLLVQRSVYSEAAARAFLDEAEGKYE